MSYGFEFWSLPWWRRLLEKRPPPGREIGAPTITVRRNLDPRPGAEILFVVDIGGLPED